MRAFTPAHTAQVCGLKADDINAMGGREVGGLAIMSNPAISVVQRWPVAALTPCVLRLRAQWLRCPNS